MRIQTLVRLARSNTAADRSRIHLTVGALAVSGALLMAALRVARLGPGDLSQEMYSNYVAETGLRSGLTTMIVCVAILIGGVGAQALRIGTAARERRLAALTLAGASQRQVRLLAITDAGLAGFFAGLWTGPVYLVLTLGFSGLPRMARVLLPAEPRDLAVWPLVIVLMTLGGLGLGSLLHHLPSPTGSPHRPRPALVIVVLIVSVLIAVLAIGFHVGGVATVGIGLLAGVCGAGGSLARWGGRRLVRSGRWVNLLVGARLVADSRPAGRMAAILFCCGILIGGLANGAATTSFDVDQSSWVFYTTGMVLAAVGVILVMVTAQLSLIVAAASQLVEHRRQLAALAALGAGPGLLRRAVRRQLAVVAAPALATGALVGSLGGLLNLAIDPPGPAGAAALVTGLLLPPLGWLMGELGAAAAGFLLRNHIRDAVDPGNLRAA